MSCRIPLILLLSCGLFASCSNSGSSSAPVEAPVKATLAAAPGAQDPNAGVGPGFVYSPIGKRDPFRSYLYDVKQQEVSRRRGRNLEVTEKYELEQYHFTGVVTGSSIPKALVEDPTGRGHIVVPGSRLGKNGGFVETIAGLEMVIVEKTLDATGKPIRVSITKRLPRTDFEQTAEE
jgi:type IV pilus assembly protein PilP